MKFRIAQPVDLPRLNQVIADAISTWQVAERVRKLSRHAYQYDESDLADGQVLLLTDPSDEIVGVAHWGPASRVDAPAESINPAILHGLYLQANRHGQGLGKRLLAEAMRAACAANHDWLTLRAQRDAEAFFRSQGFIAHDEADPPLYPRRMSQRLTQS
ncbi:MAG: N-acetyltransferase family protein [Burkholderiaceae bacterium]